MWMSMRSMSRTGDFRNVALDHGRSALAVAAAVIVKSAGAGIHRGRKHETRRERERHRRARDRDSAVFQRLAEHFQNISRELRQFIEKEQVHCERARLLRGAGLRRRRSVRRRRWCGAASDTDAFRPGPCPESRTPATL